MIEIHQGIVDLSYTFEEVRDILEKKETQKLITSGGKAFTASAGKTRDGRKVISFFQDGIEFARAYECCWGRYYNCNRTRIGMYTSALDCSMKKGYDPKLNVR